MSPVSFEVVGARVEAYAAVPTLILRLRIVAADGEPIHALALRSQIMPIVQASALSKPSLGER